MEEDLSLEELEKMEEIKFEIEENAFKVDKAFCSDCKKKMEPVVENKDLFKGSMTIHIIKFRCGQCGKEYLDLNQAEKYELFLKLSKVSEEKPLEFLNQCLTNGKVMAEGIH